MTSVRPADRDSVRRSRNFNVAIFSDSTNVINVELCMTVQLMEFLLIHTTFGDIG